MYNAVHHLPSVPTLSRMLGLDWNRILKFAIKLVWWSRCLILPETCLHCCIFWSLSPHGILREQDSFRSSAGPLVTPAARFQGGPTWGRPPRPFSRKKA